MAKRARLVGVSPLARASARSKVEDVEKILKDADSDGDSLLSLEELQSYLGDYLGYGQSEIRDFFNEYKSEAKGKVDLAGLKQGFPRLNPYLVGKRKDCTIWRKPGAVSAPGAQMNIEDLVDCKVYVCDKTEQTFVDECSGCEVLIGPCEGATFIRDCKNCTFWVATRQLRTRGCMDCTFYLHSHTEPIIEASKELRFAPFAASYAGLAEHMASAKMDPGKNFWNAIYDFTGRADGANWRILSLGECQELELHLGEAPEGDAWHCPAPELCHELLCTEPLKSDEGTGKPMAQVPQTRPRMPERTGAKASRQVVCDEVLSEAAAKDAKDAKDARPVKPEGAAATGGGYPTPKPDGVAPAGGYSGGVGQRPPSVRLKKPEFIKVKTLTPESKGVNIFAKVVKLVEGDEPGVSDVVVGDDTGTVTLRARGPQVELCKVGSVLQIQNAVIVVLRGFMRVEVHKGALLKTAAQPVVEDFGEVNVKNDLSAIEHPSTK